MSKTRKIWLGILTFLPLVFFVAYFILFFFLFINTFQNIEQHNQNEFPVEFFTTFIGLFICIGFAALSSLGIMIYYIIHANNNTANDSNKKLMWTLILVFTSTIGSIVYYFIEIIPNKKTIEPTHKA